MNLRVQQLAKEQQQCHKEVSSRLGEAADGEREPWVGSPGARPDPGWWPPAPVCSCSRPTVSSAGGSPSTTSVSRDAWAGPSSRCRCGSSHPAPGSWRTRGVPSGRGLPGWGSANPSLGVGPPGAEGYCLVLSGTWTPPPGHQRRRGPSGQASAGGPEGGGVAGHGQAGAAGADPGGWAAGLGLRAGGGRSGQAGTRPSGRPHPDSPQARRRRPG